jgi:hypothetical protein
MRRWAATIAVLLCATGCASGSSARGPAETSSSAPSSAAEALPTVGEPAPPVDGMSAEAVQLRTDAAAGGRIQVRITASDTFSVTSVALDSPGFAPLPPTRLISDFTPGRVTDLRTPFGDPRCDVSPEPASARLTVVRDGGQPEEVDVPLEADVLVRIHAKLCAAEALAELVDIEVTDLRADGDATTANLTLTRRSGTDEVRVTRLMRSVLVAVDVDLPLVLAADADTASTPLRFTPASCDAHVLAETKQPFLFPLAVQVADADEVAVSLPVTDETRARLQDLVQRVCH